MVNTTQTIIKDIRVKNEPEPDPTLLKEIQAISFLYLFRFADKYDYLLMTFGSICAIANGAALPAFTILWGNMINSFGISNTDTNQMIDNSKAVMFQFFQLGAGIFVVSWLMFTLWMITGERQGIQCRKVYLKKLLEQQVGWYDRVNQTELASKFASQTFSFQGAIGQKIGTFIMVISAMISGLIIALYKGWQLGLVVLSYLPVLALMGAVYVTVLQNRQKKTRQFYTNAGGKAQQTIGAIKTVKSLNGQDYQYQKFKDTLEKASQKTINYVSWAGFGMGGMTFAIFSSYALAFWYGSRLISEHTIISGGTLYDAGSVITVFFSLFVGGTNLSNISPCFQKFTEGKQAAARIYALVDRKPKMQLPKNGKKLQKIVGVIKFINVTFSYPKDPKKIILNNVSLQIKPNQTNALVGESGCGKSTIMQLIMRFYDPNEGRITLDGIDLRDFDLTWLRSNIGYVGQQPVLFATTIKQNLLYGKPTATDQQIQQALKKAQAYQFVHQLDYELQTNVGYGGGQFSGGQKQRIAIARAILKNPKILLLDEATSALDRKNQRLIQHTLDKITGGRTTITIAHRIKTIMNAEQIFVFENGRLRQNGTFNQLKRFRTDQDDELTPKFLGKKKSSIILALLQNEENEEKKEKEKKIEPIKNQQQQKRKQQMIQKYGGQVFSRLFKYNLPDLGLFILGIFIAMGNGIIYPLFSLTMANMLATLINISYGSPQSDANSLSLQFFILGIASFIASGLQTSIFLVIGEKITKRLRIDTFKKIIHMPVSWFDLPRNNSGSLAAKLSTDCQMINGLTSTLISINIQIITTLIAGIIIAFYNQWRISLVTLGLLPLMIGAGMMRMKFMMGFSAKTDQAYKDSSNIIMQSMQNIRTVMSFGVENSIYQSYINKLVLPLQLAYKNANISGFLYGVTQYTMFAIFALIFFIGTIFISRFGIGYDQVFTAIYAIMFAAIQVGNNSQHMPDVGSSKNSAVNIFELLDQQDQNMIQEKQKSKMLKYSEFQGLIEIKNITFKYPTRTKEIFNQFSMRIQPGTKIAFVGSSGCGKSTIIQLLLRFYEPEAGQILLDRINIRDYDIYYLRSLFGLVSQQPVLFYASFRQNIQYNLKDVSIKDIRQAAKKSRALNFIEGDQQIQQKQFGKQIIQGNGFDRNVGIKGSHISGGQKQRVAIARCVLRNPRILLLDEATSALDSKNQKIVQQSLDQIMKGLSTITIAHRIQTIKNSDKIFVFDEGKVVESGKYDQLVKLKGYFYHLEQGSSR